MPHQSTENYTLDGYHVPTGTRLIINIPNLHRDPHVWSDPNEFRPERFLTTHKDVDVRGQISNTYHLIVIEECALGYHLHYKLYNSH